MTSHPGLEVIRSDLRQLGLSPLTWGDVLEQISQRLGPGESERFGRLHRNFVAYPTESTLRKFYGFCYQNRLHDLLAGFRFERLTRILGTLEATLGADGRFLEVGAGGGYVLRWLQTHQPGLHLAATDWAKEAQALWPAGTLEFETRAGYDFMLFADSLGETHGDDDGLLSGPSPASLPNLEIELEQRYGFGAKLETWRPHLTPNGLVLLLEPLRHVELWPVWARVLTGRNWQVVQTLTSLPAPGLLLRNAQSRE